MAGKQELSKSMSEDEFVNAYWYATELKTFAKSIGISPVTRLRKDELESLILEFLRTGIVKSPIRAAHDSSVRKDSEKGLTRELSVVRYTNDLETKDFLRKEAIKIDPEFRPKSGAMYRLNRWREQQIAGGRLVTYGDLADKYVELCQTQGPFPQAPSGRYINFLSDFLKLGKRRHTTTGAPGLDAAKEVADPQRLCVVEEIPTNQDEDDITSFRPPESSMP